MHWTPSQSNDTGWLGDEAHSVELEGRLGTIHWFHGAKLVGPNPENRESEMGFALRILCHIFIDHISDRGIPEVCESLRESYQYYEVEEGPQKLLTVGRDREAVMGTRQIRTAFTVDGE